MTITLTEGLLIGLGVAWIGWVSFNLVSFITRRQETNSMVTKLIDSIADLRNDFAEMKKEVKEDVAEVSNRLDTFVKNELDTLKDISRRRS